MTNSPFVIDCVIDVVCPWCYVGKRQLDAALDEISQKVANSPPFLVRYHPYQLNPDAPLEGVGRDAYYKTKFGETEAFKQTRAHLIERGRTLGISFNYEKDGLIANTMDSHRLIYWAQSAGKDVQAKIVDRLMKLYFEDVAFLGDSGILREAAQDCGMDGEIVSELLASEKDRATIEALITQAYQLGIRGVPFFVFGGKKTLSGAAEQAEMVDAISYALNLHRVT